MNEDRNEFIHQLHIKYYRRLIRTAYRETGDMETAADLVQEVFVLATLQYDSLRTYDAPEAWLLLTLHYQVLNQRPPQRGALSGGASSHRYWQRSQRAFARRAIAGGSGHHSHEIRNGAGSHRNRQPAGSFGNRLQVPIVPCFEPL